MDMLNQALLEHLAVFTEIPQAPSASNSKDDGQDFGKMVDQKRQEPSDAPKAEDAPGKEKTEAPDKPQQAQKPQEPAQPTDNQMGVAAAMLLQGQPDPRTMELLQEKAPEQTMEGKPVQAVPEMAEPQGELPQAMAAEAVSVQTSAPQAVVQAETPQVQENVPQAQPQQAEAKPEAHEQAAPEATAEVKPAEQAETPAEAPKAVQAEQPREEKPGEGPQLQAAKTPERPAEETVKAENVEVENAGEKLFQDVEAMPVKVAEPQKEAAIPLEAEEGVEKLAKAVDDALPLGDTKVELTLTPANLGKITVELTHSQDGAIHVVLSASTHSAEKLLEQHSGNLQSLLAASGRENVKVEVQNNQQAQQQPQFLNPDGQNRQQQEQEQQHQQQRQYQKHETEDFIQQLRLGLFAASAN